MTTAQLLSQIRAAHAELSSEQREAMIREHQHRQVEAFNAERGHLDDGYDCVLCLNRGMIMNPDGSISFCACKPIRDSLQRLRGLGLSDAARRLTFERFRAGEPWQQTLLSRAQAFARSDTPGWLFIGGQSGCGKTHLCTAAAVELLYRGHALRYMRWMNDTARLKALALDPERDRIMRRLIDAPVLYVDDLFKSQPTQADLHIAFELLDARYCDTKKRTIISSERTLDDLMHIDEAIAGRILERCGDDFLLSIPRCAARNARTTG